MKNASHEFIFYKLIARIILGLGNNLCLWGTWRECQDMLLEGKCCFPWLNFFLYDSHARIKFTKFKSL